MNKTGINAARLETSERLQRVAALLEDGLWHSTLEIIQRAHACAVNSAICELRANGLRIETRCSGRGIYEYRLTRNVA